MEATSLNTNEPGASSPSSELESIQAKLDEIKRTKKVAKHKDGRPLRPLSAYNIFFQLERSKIMKEQADPSAKHAAGGFGNLAMRISAKWKNIDTATRMELNAMAKLDKERYARENEEWKLNMLRTAELEKAKAEAVDKDAEEFDVDDDVPPEVSPFVLGPSPFAASQQTLTGAVAFPSLLSQTSRGSALSCFPMGNGASTERFARIMNPERGNFFSFGSLQEEAHYITPDQLSRQTLQFNHRSSQGDFEGYMCAASAPPFVKKRISYDDATQSKEDLTDTRGCAQGFKKSGFCSQKNSSADRADDTNNVYPEESDDKKSDFVNGYLHGFKAASEMWGMTGM